MSKGKGCSFILIWFACVIVGALAGFALGWVIWKLGFELIGSAVALVGAGIGGILAFLAVLRWMDDRDMEGDDED